jgi:hypothetical protein
MHGSRAWSIENTICKQWTAVVRVREPCSARKAGAGTPARQDAGAELRSVLLPDKIRRSSPARGCAQNKNDPGQVRDRGANHQFQFPEYSGAERFVKRDIAGVCGPGCGAVPERCTIGRPVVLKVTADNRLDAFVYAPEALHVEERTPSFHTGVANRSSGMNTPTR